MSIKEKFPIINSNNRKTRIVGYIIYMFFGLVILSAITPNPPSSTTIEDKSTDNTPKELTTTDVKFMLPGAIEDPSIHLTKSDNGYNVVISYKDKYKGRKVEKWIYDVSKTQISAYERLFKDQRIASVTINSMCYDPTPTMEAITSNKWEDGIKTTISRKTYESEWYKVIEDPSQFYAIADDVFVNDKIIEAIAQGW